MCFATRYAPSIDQFLKQLIPPSNDPGKLRVDVDLSRFDAAPLIAFTATKETDYGTEPDGRIPQGRGAYRVNQ
jgi:hypothetical protein